MLHQPPPEPGSDQKLPKISTLPHPLTNRLCHLFLNNFERIWSGIKSLDIFTLIFNFLIERAIPTQEGEAVQLVRYTCD